MTRTQRLLAILTLLLCGCDESHVAVEQRAIRPQQQRCWARVVRVEEYPEEILAGQRYKRRTELVVETENFNRYVVWGKHGEVGDTLLLDPIKSQIVGKWGE